MLTTDQNLPKFESDIYNRIAMNDLVTNAWKTRELRTKGGLSLSCNVSKIHEHFVDAQHRNPQRKGRPSKDELLAKATVAG